MMNMHDHQTIKAMETYGGSFVKVLAVLAKLADSDNLKRLKVAFPEYWDKYGEMAKNKNDQ